MSGRDFLEQMAEASRARARGARSRESESALLARARACPAAPPLRVAEFDVIAELKMRSPAAGELQSTAFDKQAQIEAYGRGGACAVSVLTEPEQFRGSLADLEDAAAHLRRYDIPAMRKDFITEPYQLLEARAAGAGGALIIVTMLDDGTVGELLDCAAELGLFVLLEGFDAGDLQRIAQLTAATDPERVLAGVNCRDLKTLHVDFERFAALAPALPGRLRSVAESGVGSAADVRSIAALGYRLALIGSALMSGGDAATRLHELINAGRTAAAAARAAP